MHWVQRERGEHREDHFLKVVRVVLLFFVRELIVAEKKNVIFLQGRDQLLPPGAILVVHHFTHPRRNSRELFAGAHSIGPSRTDITLVLLLQTSDPYLKE